MFLVGERPGKGTYRCERCHARVTLDDSTDALPHCPKCHYAEYTTYGYGD
ncbi:MAG: zinc ribbon-containing protein [Fibrobacterales bacterium]